MKLPEAERKAVAGSEPFPKLTERTVTNMSDLEAQLVQFSELGYAVDDQEVVMGGLCLAAPIVSSDGKLLGGISISGPAPRLPKSSTIATAELSPMPLLKSASPSASSWVSRNRLGRYHLNRAREPAVHRMFCPVM